MRRHGTDREDPGSRYVQLSELVPRFSLCAGDMPCGPCSVIPAVLSNLRPCPLISGVHATFPGAETVSLALTIAYFVHDPVGPRLRSVQPRSSLTWPTEMVYAPRPVSYRPSVPRYTVLERSGTPECVRYCVAAHPSVPRSFHQTLRSRNSPSSPSPSPSPCVHTL